MSEPQPGPGARARRRRGLHRRLAPETRGLARDSLVLGVSHAIAAAGQMLQVAIITHALGLQQYGVFALVVSIVAVVSRFFDAQVGQAALAFAPERMKRSMREVAGVFQLTYIVDFAAGILGFAVVVAIAPFIGDHISSEGTLLLVLYGVTLLASTVDTTSISLLMLFDRYSAIIWIVAGREVLRVAGLVAAVSVFDSLAPVMAILALQDAAAGAIAVVLASRVFRSASGGVGLLRPALETVRGVRREMLGMMFHTNFVSYVRIVQTQVPAIVLGAFRGPTEVGIFKVGSSAAVAVARVADPAWAAVTPRLSRLWTDRRDDVIRRLLRQASVVSFLSMTAIGLVVVVFREPLLRLYAGEEAVAAGSVLAIGVLAQVVNGVVFWNSPLLLVSRQARLVSRAYVTSLVLLVPMLLIGSDRWGAEGAAFALLVSIVYVNVAMTVAALRTVRGPHDADRTPVPVDEETAGPSTAVAATLGRSPDD